jgi:hypothetical protein
MGAPLREGLTARASDFGVRAPFRAAFPALIHRFLPLRARIFAHLIFHPPGAG